MDQTEKNGTATVLATITNDPSLAERVADLEAKLHQLRVRLFGDEEAQRRFEEDHAKWSEARRTYVTPRGDEPQPPPKGDIDRLLEGLGAMSDTLNETTRMLQLKMRHIEELDGKRFAAVDRLLKWAGPLLDDPQFAPPLNGTQVASKSYVDTAVERIAGRIREQVRDAIHLADRMANAGAATYGRQLGSDESRTGSINQIVDAIAASWRWISEEIDRRNRPTRAQIARRAIGAIITGKHDRE